MIYSADERAMIWLCACSGTDNRTRADLLRAAGGDPKELYENYAKFAAQVINRGKSVVYKEGCRLERERELDRLLERMEQRGQFAVACFDEDYPDELKRMMGVHILGTIDPPLVLFCKGNRALLKEKKFGIVGSRRTPAWAEAQGRKIAEILSNRLVIVTGFAEGGDLAAIRGALASGNLICVLPNGLDECYPAAHASLKEEVGQKGLLVTECPPSEKVHKGSFHLRNRILAGLARDVLVLSAGKKSGALITANYVVESGGNVYALPYSLGVEQGEGCNALIKNGAYLCTGAEDILLSYGLSPKETQPKDLSDAEMQVLKALKSEDLLHAAKIAEITEMPVYEVSAVLTMLELKGLAVKAGGNRYSAT